MKAEVVRLKKAKGQAGKRLLQLQQTHESLSKRRRELRVRLKAYEAIQRTRAAFDATTTRVGGYLCTVAVSGAGTLIAAGLLGVPFAPHLACAAGTAAGVLGLAAFLPNDDDLKGRVERAERDWNEFETEVLELDCEIGRAEGTFANAKAAYKTANALYRGRIHRLRRVAWDGMRGVEFEEFLADVFREHGYTVETTKVTGDQGVDLVLTGNGRRFAVQAKGYPSSTVGNSAVQEAFTGAAFYKCDCAVVVTNSTFTASAREAAAQVGCRLIDGGEIPGLIEGTVRL